MSEKELANILSNMYNNAPSGYAVANIHLFGIKYARELVNCKISEIVHLAGLYQSYTTEVSKGVKLAEYVIPKF